MDTGYRFKSGVLLSQNIWVMPFTGAPEHGRNTLHKKSSCNFVHWIFPITRRASIQVNALKVSCLTKLWGEVKFDV